MDISSLRDRSEGLTLSVSELNRYIKGVIENNPALSKVTVRGELSNFTYHSSGHLYFSLKDEEGQIRAVMFRAAAARLHFVPKDGMKVILAGSVTLYPKTGVYQIVATMMQPDGVGALYMAYEQLKEKLASEGIFDSGHKLPIPRYPARIGVITSPTGAAVRDIVHVTGRRYPLAEIYLYPSLVQGDFAEENLISALDYFERSRLVDVIIIGRGGGSIEDLWAFNGEKLARKIYDMTVPTVSAVGHETDFTICDFVADLRAPTPSAAAELVTPDYKELLLGLDELSSRLSTTLARTIERRADRLRYFSERPLFRRADDLFRDKAEGVSRLSDKLDHEIRHLLDRRAAELKAVIAKTESLSPLSVLARGYALVEGKGGAIRSVAEIEEGEALHLRLSDGELYATVTEKRKI